MSAPPYMKFYWGDYLKDTTHLKPLEHAAYLLLIGAMWQAKGKLPNDDAILARHARMTPKEWAMVRSVVLAFFRAKRGALVHKRIDAEIGKYNETVAKRKEAGKIGSSVTNGKKRAIGAANAEKKTGKCRHNQSQNQSRRDIAQESYIPSTDAPYVAAPLESAAPTAPEPGPGASLEDRQKLADEIRKSVGLRVVSG